MSYSIICVLLVVVTHIINCTPSQPCYYEGEINYLRIPIVDTPNEDLTSYFNRIKRFVNNARQMNGNILVHCVSGE